MKTIAITIGKALGQVAIFIGQLAGMLAVGLLIALVVMAVLFGIVGLATNGHEILGMLCLCLVLLGMGFAISNA